MWVNFKVFGLLGMTLVFTLLSGVYLYRHIPAEHKEQLKK
jgi:intracellular septation protein